MPYSVMWEGWEWRTPACLVSIILARQLTKNNKLKKKKLEHACAVNFLQKYEPA